MELTIVPNGESDHRSTGMDPIGKPSAHYLSSPHTLQDRLRGSGIMNAVAIPRPPVIQATGLRRRLYVVIGLFFVGLGILGAMLPVMPTTPWLLIASYFFARSSPRLEAWLRRTPYFGHLIRDWDEHRGVRPGVKASAIGIVVVVVGCTCLYSNAPIWAKWSAASLAAVGVACILFVVPTVRAKANDGPTSATP